MPYGVEPQRTGPPIVGQQIDRQRLFHGKGGDLSMGATPRRKSQSRSLTSAQPGAYQSRKRGKF